MITTKYTATWRWTTTGEKASLTYNESSLPAALAALRQAVAEKRVTRARLTACTVLFDSAAGIDAGPGSGSEPGWSS